MKLKALPEPPSKPEPAVNTFSPPYAMAVRGAVVVTEVHDAPVAGEPDTRFVDARGGRVGIDLDLGGVLETVVRGGICVHIEPGIVRLEVYRACAIDRGILVDELRLEPQEPVKPQLRRIRCLGRGGAQHGGPDDRRGSQK